MLVIQQQAEANKLTFIGWMDGWMDWWIGGSTCDFVV
jgi:hypothetical protein